MAFVLFIVYFFAALFVINRIKFIRDAGLSRSTVWLLFTIKIGAGCFLGAVNHFLLNNATDYDAYNTLGITEYDHLVHAPRIFFTDIFRSNYHVYGEFFGSAGSYWNDLRTNIIFKALGLMDVFSRGNYYINSLFFNFLCFFGHIALYRVFVDRFPGKKIAVIIGCFLLPSLLYFSSGVHKDPIIFTAMAMFCHGLYFSFDCGFSVKRVSLIIVSLLLILLIRNFVAVALLPFALAWLISRKYHLKPLAVYGSFIAVAFAAILILHYRSAGSDPLRIVAAKQQAFFLLGKATTQYHNDTLSPSIKNFIHAAPKAAAHVFFTPYPGEFGNWHTQILSLEMILYALIALFGIWLSIFHRRTADTFLIFCFGFSLTMLLLAGYITPSAGALIRYRSLYLPFLITPLLCAIADSRIRHYNK